MQKHLITGIVGLLIGLAGGFIVANSINRSSLAETAASPNPTVNVTSEAAQAVPQSAMLPDVNETLEKAEAEPQNFAVQMKTGDMYAKIGRFDKAAEYYKRGVVLNPNNFEGNIVLANALFDSQKFEEAEGYYSKALQINPKDVNARTDFGTTFVERPSPDYDRAIAEFRTALETEPKHEPTLYYLGIAYFRKGEKDKATQALAELEKANPSSELVVRLKQNLGVQ